MPIKIKKYSENVVTIMTGRYDEYTAIDLVRATPSSHNFFVWQGDRKLHPLALPYDRALGIARRTALKGSVYNS